MRSANFGWLKLCEIWSSNYEQKEKKKKGKRKRKRWGCVKLTIDWELPKKKNRDGPRKNCWLILAITCG